MVTSQWRSQPQVDCCSAPIWPRGIIMFRYLRDNLFFYGWVVIHCLQYNSTVFTILDILALSLNRMFIVSTFFLFQLTNTRDLVRLIYDVISNVIIAINDRLFLLNYVSMWSLWPFQHYFNTLNQSMNSSCSVARIRKFIHPWHRNTIVVHRPCLTSWSCVQMNSCISVSEQGVANNSLHGTIGFGIKCFWYHFTIARYWHDLTGMTIRYNIISYFLPT